MVVIVKERSSYRQFRNSPESSILSGTFSLYAFDVFMLLARKEERTY